jgi:hypothetical protein
LHENFIEIMVFIASDHDLLFGVLTHGSMPYFPVSTTLRSRFNVNYCLATSDIILFFKNCGCFSKPGETSDTYMTGPDWQADSGCQRRVTDMHSIAYYIPSEVAMGF